jgi:hypothetical protein
MSSLDRNLEKKKIVDSKLAARQNNIDAMQGSRKKKFIESLRRMYEKEYNNSYRFKPETDSGYSGSTESVYGERDNPDYPSKRLQTTHPSEEGITYAQLTLHGTDPARDPNLPPRPRNNATIYTTSINHTKKGDNPPPLPPRKWTGNKYKNMQHILEPKNLSNRGRMYSLNSHHHTQTQKQNKTGYENNPIIHSNPRNALYSPLHTQSPPSHKLYNALPSNQIPQIPNNINTNPFKKNEYETRLRRFKPKQTFTGNNSIAGGARKRTRKHNNKKRTQKKSKSKSKSRKHRK